jgi:hypothetical protein
VSARLFGFVITMSQLIAVALALLWLTAALIFFSDPATMARLAASEIFRAKLTIVILLTLDAFLVHRIALPHMRARLGAHLFARTPPESRRILAAVAAVSATSWVLTLILALTKHRLGPIGYLDVLTVYGVLLGAAICTFACTIGIIARRRNARETLDLVVCLARAIKTPFPGQAAPAAGQDREPLLLLVRVRPRLVEPVPSIGRA